MAQKLHSTRQISWKLLITTILNVPVILEKASVSQLMWLSNVSDNHCLSFVFESLSRVIK